jgi:glutathione S-transferase
MSAGRRTDPADTRAHAIDYEFPAWAAEYITAVEAALGGAYSEPASDVRGFVASAKSQDA